MSDFLTRLVTATYVPAASVRPRPVARYEPAAQAEASPPVQLETPATEETALTSEVPARHVASRPSGVPLQRAEQAMFEQQASPGRHAAEPGTAHPAALPTENGSTAVRVQAANGDAAHPPAPASKPQPLSHARPVSVLPAPAPEGASSGPGQPVARTRSASAPRTAQSPRPVPQPLLPVALLPAAIVREPEIFQRAPHGALVDEQKSAADEVVLPHREALAARRADILRADTPAADDRRTEPEPRHKADSVAEAMRSGRLAGSQDRAPAAQPVGVNAPASPAPVIRVSIGRIVVKAENPPSAKPASPRPAQPALSLDGYLKTRSGGEA